MSAMIFTTPSYAALADAVARRVGAERGRYALQHFPDGERGLALTSSVQGRDVVLLGGAVDDEQTLLLLDLASGLVDAGAERLTLLLPYFAYSTMEHATHAGEVVTARSRALLFSAIPRAPRGVRVALLDPHAEALPYYFAPDLHATVIGVDAIVEPMARRLGGQDYVLASADAGRAKWVERMAARLGVPAGFVHKRRLAPDRTEVVALMADVKGRAVVLLDDMVRSGATLLSAARAYRAAGATRVSVFATHGVLPGDALERLVGSGLFDALVTTDSHPRARALAGPTLEVVSVAPWLASWLLHVSGEAIAGEVPLEVRS
jgi:ribose-phosphate pyrophosphokinase